ncbi:hypothetical protein LMJ38_32540 [Streptomyces sp. R1]|uniref:hypothetical protein n=1 Tax=unclassified Streptomyces TaxID=2593676 RepID=UPI001E53CB23|nr:hypothetical protein [Streptomyces sp. R1]MCC8340631.1 hypothetical protein [Streptomyces sp. R1]MDA4892457.1 hypothetical protein [Streptomyces sp. MS2A]
MRALRRVGLFGALPLVLALTAAYVWYRGSDTGRGWRYQDKLASYCGGLIPYDESAVFTGLNTDVGLSRDAEHGYGEDRFRSCRVADLTVSVGLVRADAVRSDVSPGMLNVLDSGSSEHPPTALGGGWHGYTDLRDTGVVLPCANKDASVVVSVAADASHENGEESRAVAELATAVAREAAGRRSCETTFGGRIPELSLSKGQTAPEAASGTCEGIRIPEAQWVDWIHESEASDSAPLERCLLGETKARDEVLYSLEASFGPYAQRLRSADHDEHWPEPGITHGSAQATASCSDGTVPAVFRIRATVYAAPTEQFLRSALRTFAERSAVRHGCTNLELPD